MYEYHKGTKNEIISNLKESDVTAHSYSWYFGRKFADFGGLYLGFFSAVLLAFLFIRDTKRDTYELLPYETCHCQGLCIWESDRRLSWRRLGFCLW